MGGRWERGSGGGTHVHPWLIHVNVWQKPPQYCKVIILRFKLIIKKKFFFKEEEQKKYYSHIHIEYNRSPGPRAGREVGPARLVAGMWAAVSGLGGHSSCCQDHPIPMGQQRATAQGQPGSQLTPTHLEHRFGVHQNCVCVGEGISKSFCSAILIPPPKIFSK